jgi:hypothetical protein
MMTTCQAAQTAQEEQLKALQQIKQQCLLKKQQRNKEWKKVELEAKQHQDAEATERATLA